MGAVPALIAAAIALATLRDSIDDLETGISPVDDLVEDSVDDSEFGELRDNTYAATGRYTYSTYISANNMDTINWGRYLWLWYGCCLVHK